MTGRAIIEWASLLGAAPGDSLDLRLRRAILVISTLLIGGAGLVWGGMYLALGARPVGFIPIAYSLLSTISFVAFVKSGSFERFRTVQLGLIFCLPIALQVLLGGMVEGSAVMLWSILAPLGALMFGARRPSAWFAMFVLAALACGVAESTIAALAVNHVPIPPVWRTTFFVMNLASPVAVAYVMLGYLVRGEEQLRSRIREQEKALDEAKKLGPYTLERKLGAGGMGVVYRARHALLRRPTAVKMLPVEKVGEESLRRFEREVQLTATLSHPNTVAIHDYGRSAAGVFYYAMEYLDGVDLETLVRRSGPLPAPRVVYILDQVCGALDEAHHRGLVHRDIKPANIMICRLGNRPDVAKVLDFGLVKELAIDDGATRENTFAGTPAYTAPESITDPTTVGPRADLYALGAVAYWLLTGQPLYRAATVVEMFAHHLHTVPEPLSRHVNDVSKELEDIVLMCLAKQASERPVSARALKRLLAGVSFDKPWTEERANAWWDGFEPSPERDAMDPVTGSSQTLEVDLRERVDRERGARDRAAV